MKHNLHYSKHALSDQLWKLRDSRQKLKSRIRDNYKILNMDYTQLTKAIKEYASHYNLEDPKWCDRELEDSRHSCIAAIIGHMFLHKDVVACRDNFREELEVEIDMMYEELHVLIKLSKVLKEEMK